MKMITKALAATTALALLSVGLAQTALADSRPPTGPETKSLQQLYQDALAEGGKLTVYAGGDAPGQLDSVKQAFESQFPGIQLTLVVDYSKFHSARIDNQLTRGRLQADVAQLQTLQDFDRWKRDGKLLAYKPAGFDQVYPQFKDRDATSVGISVIAFSNVVNTAVLPEAEAPRNATDYLDPKYKGKLVFAYPNDDDAVLYQFAQIINKYGWGYLDQLLAQEPVFVRGTATAGNLVISGQKVATPNFFWPANGVPGLPVKFLLPTTEPFLSWAQTAAIFKAAPHPAAAKLYLNWQLSKPVQDNSFLWSVRRDAVLSNGLRPIFEYNTDPSAFHLFMLDRARLERLRTQFTLYLGEPQGPPPTGILGPMPATA